MNRRSFLAFLGVAPAALPALSEPIEPSPDGDVITLPGWQLPCSGMHLANIGSLSVGVIRSADGRHQLDVATDLVSYV